jgi:hypothetical protein
MKKFSYLPYLLVGLVLLLAFGVRFYRLNDNRPPLFADEVSHYGAWAEFQNTLSSSSPFRFLKLATIGYYTFTWFLGLTPLAVRLPAVIFGTLLIFWLYSFAKTVSRNLEQKDKIVSLIVLVLGVFLPWEIHLSRLGYATSNLIMLNLVCLHFIFYCRVQTTRGYLFSLIPLLMATYFYPSMIIIAPLGVLLVLRQLPISFLKNKRFLISLPFLLGALISLFWFLFWRSSTRGLDLVIWKDINVSADSNFNRGIARTAPSVLFFVKNSESLSRFFYNYPVSVINVFARNYFSFFSPEFLFLRGDPVLRHGSGFMGEFFPFLAPFMFYGALILFRSKNRKIKELFLVWILVSPLPAAITKDGLGYLLRAVTMMPFLTYLSALGLVESVDLFRQKLKWVYATVLFLIGTYSILYFLLGYFQVYPTLAAKSYEFGFKELSDFQLAHNAKSMLVIWDGYYPHYYFRFWQRTLPQDYLKFSSKEIKVNESVFFEKYPNLYFSLPRQESDLTKFISQNHIDYLVFPTALEKSFTSYAFLKNLPIERVVYPDGQIAFLIYSLFK